MDNKSFFVENFLGNGESYFEKMDAINPTFELIDLKY